MANQNKNSPKGNSDMRNRSDKGAVDKEELRRMAGGGSMAPQGSMPKGDPERGAKANSNDLSQNPGGMGKDRGSRADKRGQAAKQNMDDAKDQGAGRGRNP